jgi:hypothetical protein
MAANQLKTRFLATIIPLPISLFIANSNTFQIKGVSTLLVAVFISLIVQEIMCRYFLFKEENMDMSRRLGEVESLIQFSSQFGPFLASTMVLLAPFLLSTIFLTLIEIIAPGGLNLGMLGWVLLCVSLGLLIDPLTPTFFESNIPESLNYLTLYVSIVLVSFGAISDIDIGLFSSAISDQILICIALLNVRITYTVELGYNHRVSINSFTPSILALFAAVATNLTQVLPML